MNIECKEKGKNLQRACKSRSERRDVSGLSLLCYLHNIYSCLESCYLLASEADATQVVLFLCLELKNWHQVLESRCKITENHPIIYCHKSMSHLVLERRLNILTNLQNEDLYWFFGNETPQLTCCQMQNEIQQSTLIQIIFIDWRTSVARMGALSLCLRAQTWWRLYLGWLLARVRKWRTVH